MTNEEIYNRIKNRIIYLDLVPGTKIREEDLAAEFGVSRTPVRSIIARLAQDGLLSVTPQKGTFVSRISTDGVNDCLFVRKAVELAIIRKVVDVIDDSGFARLLNILDEQKAICAQEPSIEKSRAFYENDNRFHKTLFEIAGQATLWDYLEENQTPLNRTRIIANLRDSERVSAVYDQHRLIVVKLVTHDKEAAYAAYEEHLDHGFDGIAPVLEQYKDYFKGENE